MNSWNMHFIAFSQRSIKSMFSCLSIELQFRCDLCLNSAQVNTNVVFMWNVILIETLARFYRRSRVGDGLSLRMGIWRETIQEAATLSVYLSKSHVNSVGQIRQIIGRIVVGVRKSLFKVKPCRQQHALS